MGNACQKGQSTTREKPHPPQLQSHIHSPQQNEKIKEIKEFLTLTSENTQSFFVEEYSNQMDAAEREKLKSQTIKDFEIIRALGKGAYGHVLQVRHKQTNELFAMKIIRKSRIQSEQDKISTLSQRFILQAMDCPFIVKLHYAFQTKSKLYLLVDLMPGGELFYLLRRRKRFPEDIARFYAAEILLALDYLHKKNIIYRDLKPQNILLDKDGHIKLTDFDLSKVRSRHDQMAFSVCGTPEYIAPEVLRGKGYTHTADLFSFASLLFDMLTGRPPFYSRNKPEMLKNIATKNVQIPASLSKEARSLLRQLFKMNPKDRLGHKDGIAELLKHEFFEDIDFHRLENKELHAPFAFKQNEINEQGFEENLDEFPKSLLNDSVMKDSPGFEGFTYLQPDGREEKEGGDILNEI